MPLKVSKRPYFVILLPVFYFLHRYVEHVNYISFASFGWITFIYLPVILVAMGFFYIFTRNWLAAGIAATFTLSINFFFGIFYDYMKSISPNGPLTRYTILVPIIILLITSTVIILRRNRGRLSRLAQYLNLLFAILLAVELVNLAISLSSRKYNDSSISTEGSNTYRPNIYLVVLDGYAGNQQLASQFNFDNSGFIDSLGVYGFHTFPYSTSNYNYTPLSIASILQMGYPDSSKYSSNNVTASFNYATDLINFNPFFDYFKKQGYQLLNHSVFRIDNMPPHTGGNQMVPADSRLLTAATFVARFENERLYPYALKKNWKWYVGNKVFVHRDYNKSMLEMTRHTSMQPVNKPRLVYTHLWMPHEPYYYNENGALRDLDSLKAPDAENRHSYLSYLKYCNKTILTLMKDISLNDKSAIIILMSDHGFRNYDMTKTDPNLVFSNIVSLRTPNNNQPTLPDTISNINVLKFILNREFGAQLPMNETRYHYIPFSNFRPR